MEHLRFDTLVRDLQVDEQARLRDAEKLVPAHRRYIILFSARSGSTWLSSVLSATKKLGFPDEFINPDFIVAVARACNAKTPEHLLGALMRRRKSPNNVFGMEARAVDVELLGFDAFRQAFGAEALFFHLWRENLVAQGISLFRAVETNQYHSNSAAAKSTPAYDADGIFRWIRHIANTENANVELLRKLGAPARHLRYEDMIAEREKTVELFAHAMAVPFSPGDFSAPMTGVLNKLADDWNLEAEARFRSERAADVKQFEDGRLVKIGIAPNPHAAPPSALDALAAWGRGHRSATASRSPRNNPFEPQSALGQNWLAGWKMGWDDQKYI